MFLARLARSSRVVRLQQLQLGSRLACGGLHVCAPRFSRPPDARQDATGKELEGDPSRRAESSPRESDSRGPELQDDVTSSGVERLSDLDSEEWPSLDPIPPPALPPLTWISKEDHEKWLPKLFKRRWMVSETPSANGQTTLSLKKNFYYKTAEGVAKFTQRLSMQLLLEQNTGTVTLRKGHLTFITYTPSALPLVSQDAGGPSSNQRLLPGLTMADVRTAYVIEDLWEHSRREFRLISQGPAPSMHIKPITASTGQLIMAPNRGRCPNCGGYHALASCHARSDLVPCKFCGSRDHKAGACPKKPRRCIVCGGPHDIRECPDRKHTRPFKPCSACGGDHWVYDCPRPARCMACGGQHHLRECPERHTHKAPPCAYCGEDHWRVDCPTASTICRACGGHHILQHCPKRQGIPPPHPCSRCGGNHWGMDCPTIVKCGACGGNHLLKECPSREYITPRLPCSRCGQHGHWSVDCPNSDACPACGGSHKLMHCSKRAEVKPPSPCKNCGGDHWLVDCPETPHCPACGGEHKLHKCPQRTEIKPPNPCEACGGMHWSLDCPLRKDGKTPSMKTVTDSIINLARSAMRDDPQSPGDGSRGSER